MDCKCFSEVGSYLKLGGQVVMWRHNLPPLVEIGLTALPKPGWAIAHHAPQSPTSLLSYSRWIAGDEIGSHNMSEKKIPPQEQLTSMSFGLHRPKNVNVNHLQFLHLLTSFFSWVFSMRGCCCLVQREGSTGDHSFYFITRELKLFGF